MLDSVQFNRKCRVVVGKNLQGRMNIGTQIEGLRVKFTIDKSLRGPPNTASVYIYNLSETTSKKIKDEFDDVMIEAGYAANPRIIFRGDIKLPSPFHYKEGSDWITEIQAADGDRDYSTSLVNTTIKAGSSAEEAVAKILDSMPRTKRGAVSVSGYRYIRGRVLSGRARQVLDTIAADNGAAWSIQDGFLDIVQADAVLPVEAIIVNSETGMLGAPEISGKGIKVKMLLNPQVRVNGTIVLQNENIKIKSIQQYVGAKKVKEKRLTRLDPDGRYKVYKLRHEGDTHGADWYTEAECVAIGQPAPRG